MNKVRKQPMLHEAGSEIACQNKDITAKYLTEGLKGKTLKAYGLPELKVVDIHPTNLLAIEANELRIVKVYIGPAYLVSIDTEETFQRLCVKISQKNVFDR